jgi:hypothetical protein
LIALSLAGRNCILAADKAPRFVNLDLRGLDVAQLDRLRAVGAETLAGLCFYLPLTYCLTQSIFAVNIFV